MRQVTFPFWLRGPARRGAVAEPFWFPLPVPARTALVEAGFRAGPNMRAFAAEEMEMVEKWGPEAIVLPLHLALSLAEQKRCERLVLPSVDTAIVVLTSVHAPSLSDHDRDILWRAFGVPVFEQLRGADGAVIARECEVHDGLHVVGPVPDLEGERIEEHCACGSETPRLRRSGAVFRGRRNPRSS